MPACRLRRDGILRFSRDCRVFQRPPNLRSALLISCRYVAGCYGFIRRLRVSFVRAFFDELSMLRQVLFAHFQRRILAL